MGPLWGAVENLSPAQGCTPQGDLPHWEWDLEHKHQLAEHIKATKALITNQGADGNSF